MKPKDVIEQLIGPVVAWDQTDTLAFVISPVKGPDGTQFDFCNLDFGKGIVEFGFYEGPDEGIVHQFSIHATLEPCE